VKRKGTGEQHTKGVHNFHSSPNVVRMITKK
jgi:hypothetical protein